MPARSDRSGLKTPCPVGQHMESVVAFSLVSFSIWRVLIHPLVTDWILWKMGFRGKHTFFLEGLLLLREAWAKTTGKREALAGACPGQCGCVLGLFYLERSLASYWLWLKHLLTVWWTPVSCLSSSLGEHRNWDCCWAKDHRKPETSPQRGCMVKSKRWRLCPKYKVMSHE